MLKKLFFGGMIALFVLSLLPISASANTSALQPGTLIKGSSDSVYYYGGDGKRYVFPTEKVYKSWFLTFNIVVPISSELLSELPIGGNVTYKPGVKLVKITTDPKVYYVDLNSTLRWVSSEALAKELWGSTWYTKVDDVADTSLLDYKKGEPLENPDLTAVPATYSINQDKTISDQPDPTTDDISKITLTGTVNGDLVKLSWSANFSSPLGFKSVKAEHVNPIYPGDDYHYLSTPYTLSANMQDIPVVGDTWEKLSAGTYHFRVCEYVNGSCGVYSNDLSLTISGSTTNTSNKTITLSKTVSGNTVSLSWVPSFTSSQGFKIVKAEHLNPIYPGDDYHYLSDSSARTDTWEGLSAGTYHFRVCEYLGGSCGVYSNDVTVTISGATATSNKTITLSKTVTGNTVSLSWVPSFTSSLGFKVVKAEHVNPIYPGDDYHYLSDSGARTDTWEGLSAGTYHFRVCEYLGGACGVYSNDVTVTIAGTTPETSNGSISLSGNVNSGNVYLNWVLSGMTSSMGFKVVKAEHVNPVYPGDEYHYYSDASLRTDTWEGLSAGVYHFRVCEYLGGSCGVYSNDLTLAVQ